MLKGTNLRIKLGGTAGNDGVTGGELIPLCTGCKISCTANTEETSVKTNADGSAANNTSWKNPTISGKSWSITVDRLMKSTGEFDGKASLKSKEPVLISFTLGGHQIWGQAVLSNVSISGPNKQNATESLTYTGVGKLNYK